MTRQTTGNPIEMSMCQHNFHANKDKWPFFRDSMNINDETSEIVGPFRSINTFAGNVAMI